MVLVTCGELLAAPPDIAVPGRVYYPIVTTFLPLIRNCGTPHMYYSLSRLAASVQGYSVYFLSSDQLLQSVLFIAVQHYEYESDFSFQIRRLGLHATVPSLVVSNVR